LFLRRVSPQDRAAVGIARCRLRRRSGSPATATAATTATCAVPLALALALALPATLWRADATDDVLNVAATLATLCRWSRSSLSLGHLLVSADANRKCLCKHENRYGNERYSTHLFT